LGVGSWSMEFGSLGVSREGPGKDFPVPGPPDISFPDFY
jgi:hypothetical protein